MISFKGTKLVLHVLIFLLCLGIFATEGRQVNEHSSVDEQKNFPEQNRMAYLVSKQNYLRHTKNMVIYPAFDWLWGKYSDGNEKNYFMGITQIANSAECSVKDTSGWLFQSRKEMLFTKDREYCF